MVFLLNSLPFIIVIVMGLVIRYAVPSKVGKVVFALLTVGMLFVYFQIQPSYLPKGTVKPLANAEFVVEDKPIEDRLRKNVSLEERNARMAKAEKDATERMEKLYNEAKKESENVR